MCVPAQVETRLEASDRRVGDGSPPPSQETGRFKGIVQSLRGGKEVQTKLACKPTEDPA